MQYQRDLSQPEALANTLRAYAEGSQRNQQLQLIQQKEQKDKSDVENVLNQYKGATDKNYMESASQAYRQLSQLGTPHAIRGMDALKFDVTARQKSIADKKNLEARARLGKLIKDGVSIGEKPIPSAGVNEPKTKEFFRPAKEQDIINELMQTEEDPYKAGELLIQSMKLESGKPLQYEITDSKGNKTYRQMTSEQANAVQMAGFLAKPIQVAVAEIGAASREKVAGGNLKEKEKERVEKTTKMSKDDIHKQQISWNKQITDANEEISKIKKSDYPNVQAIQQLEKNIETAKANIIQMEKDYPEEFGHLQKTVGENTKEKTVKKLPKFNSKGWELHYDEEKNGAYVNPNNPEEIEEVGKVE